MGAEQDQSVREIFLRVLEAAPGQRDAVLEEATAGRADVRQRVIQLMGAYERAGNFLAEPTVETPTVAFEARHKEALCDSISETEGSMIGPYRLVQTIGEGGFGLVFLAEQQRPVRRQVAMKIIKLGMDTRQVIARFEAERQALAIMDHPNIAKVLDGGTTQSGRPYFVMEMVRGTPITDYCDQHRLSVDERLGLFTDVCRAVQHAHQKGIIHRDLKPSNVLVTLVDGKATPKVIDFGIAKAIDQRLTEKTIFTDLHHMIGTPQYMSPEQASGNGADVDTRTDIFSLGILLYELLVGATPFDPRELRSRAYGEMQRMIRDVDPPRPSTRLSALTDSLGSIAACRKIEPKRLGQIVRGELEWIVMKALERDRTRRYETADAFGADVQRYLVGDAVTAGPATAAYRLKKFARRHKAGLAMTLAIVMALLGGLVAATIGLVQARRGYDAADKSLIKEKVQRQFAETANALAEKRREQATASEAKFRQAASEAGETVKILQDMLAAADPDKAKGRSVTVREVLDAAVKALDESPQKRLPAIESVVRRTIGLTYQSIGMWPAAEKQFRAALALRKLVAGNQRTTDLAESLNDLAALLAREREGEDPGSGRSDPIIDMSEVVTILNQALAIYREQLGNDNASVAEILNNLGLALTVSDRAAAEERFSEALAIYQKLVKANGAVDPLAVAAIQTNLGRLADYNRRPDEAEKFYREALKSYHERLGDDNTQVAMVRRNLGMALEQQQKVDEAMQEFQKALASDRKIFSQPHAFLADDYHELGWLLVTGKNDAKSAVPLLREAVRIRQLVLPPDHGDLAKSLFALARALHQDKANDDETLKYYREAARILKLRFGDKEPIVVGIGYFEAEILQRQGHFGEAEALLLKTYAEFESGPFKDNVGFHNDGVGRIANLYEEWGKAEKAREWRGKLRRDGFE